MNDIFFLEPFSWQAGRGYISIAAEVHGRRVKCRFTVEALVALGVAWPPEGSMAEALQQHRAQIEQVARNRLQSGAGFTTGDVLFTPEHCTAPAE